MDTALSITGFTIEDFEDVNLAAGLMVELEDRDFGPTTTLPGLVNPATAGTGFPDSVWDGSHVLLNHVDNLWPPVFGADPASKTILLHLPAGTKQFGMGLSHFQTANGVHNLKVNGSNMGDIGTFTNYADGVDRNLYIKLLATGSDTISTVAIETASENADAIMIDHVAFSSVPEPSVFACFGAIGLVAIGWKLRNRLFHL